MGIWKINTKTDKTLRPFIQGLSEIILDKDMTIKALPGFESVEDLRITKVRYDEGRQLNVSYQGREFKLYVFFYFDSVKDILAVRDMKENRNLLQLSLDKFIDKSFNVFEIWHDGTIPRLETVKAIDYYKSTDPDLVIDNHGTPIVLLGRFSENEKLTIDNLNFINFISKLLRFSILRHEMKEGDNDNKAEKLSLNLKKDKNQLLINNYLQKLEPGNKKEIYKWQFINSNLGKPDLNAKDFVSEIKGLKFSNLIFRLAKSYMDFLVTNHPEEYREAIRKLFEETQPIQVRVETFKQRIEELYRPLAENPKSSHQHDGRTISALLTYHNPEKYTFFMSGLYKKYCDFMGIELREHGARFPHFMQLIKELVEGYIKNNSKLIDLKKSFLESNTYPDPNHLLLAQDILYQNFEYWKVGDRNNNENETMETYNMTSKIYALNQILFGPPGTGKTYTTINRSLEILGEYELLAEGSREEIKSKYDEYIAKGRIVFTTFHQSMSYEDFIEGIKPKTIDDEASKKIVYEIEDGIFKNIANSAEESLKLKKNTGHANPVLDPKILEKSRFFKVSLGDSQTDEGNHIYEWCVKNNRIAVGWGGTINFKDVSTDHQIKEKFDASEIKIKSGNDYNLVAMKCLLLWMKEGDIIFVSNGNKKLRAIAQITGDYEYIEDKEFGFNQTRPVKWLYTDLNIPVNDVYGKSFSQASIYELYTSKIKKEYFKASESEELEINPYVLIIDEINRGNVSQIFGELITLIEEDKRKGRPESLEITLPYSKEKFSIPDNLYIIGTMNTADRSVEALDTALRRRFCFEEMPPKYDLLELQNEIEGVRIAELLISINARIEKLLSRDQLIGHSYFLRLDTIDQLKSAFYDKVIPLLQEYFYGDYGKIGLVLGEGFIETHSGEGISFAKFNGYDASDYSDKPIYSIVRYDGEENNTDFLKAINSIIA